MSEDLIIKIGADAKEAADAIGELGDKIGTENEKLSDFAKGSAVAFAALSAQVAVAAAAFSEQQQASNALATSLQNQGIYSQELVDTYGEYAEEVQKITGIEAAQVTGAQAVLQGYLGQIPVTQELTQAVADLAAKQGVDLTTAAKELGREIQTGTGRLSQMGLTFASTSTEAERTAQATAFVTENFGGMAKAANDGKFGLVGLESAIKDNEAALGQKFAPAITFVVKALTDFLTPNKEAADEINNFKAAVIAAGLVVTGLGVVIPVAIQAFTILKTAVAAFNLELTATKIALAGLGIGLVIIALVELYEHWDTVSARIKAIVQGLVTFVSGAFAGLGTVLSGAMTASFSKIKAGLAEIQTAFASGTTQAFQKIEVATEAHEVKQDTTKQLHALKRAAIQTEADRTNQQLAAANNKLLELETEGADAKEIALEKALIANLKAQKNTKDKDELVALKVQHAKIVEDLSAYSATVEQINSILHNSTLTKAEDAGSQLVGLANSKNDELKAIGKAASVAQITIKTAESAMAIFAGFASIPIIGPALGVAGAAAAIAYGAEQIGNVLAAASGGVVPGSGLGDSIPAVLTPGELVTPKANFDEVVNSVANSRIAGAGGTVAGGQSGNATVQIVLKDKLMDFIEAKLVQRKHLNVSILGG